MPDSVQKFTVLVIDDCHFVGNVLYFALIDPLVGEEILPQTNIAGTIFFSLNEALVSRADVLREPQRIPERLRIGNARVAACFPRNLADGVDSCCAPPLRPPVP